MSARALWHGEAFDSGDLRPVSERESFVVVFVVFMMNTFFVLCLFFVCLEALSSSRRCCYLHGDHRYHHYHYYRYAVVAFQIDGRR